MSLSISKDANPNYLAKVVELTNLQKHPNADSLQVAIIDFQEVITGMDAKDGDVYVFFPLECQINEEFLRATNSFRDAALNIDPEQKGFFEKKGRVKPVRLRGQRSMGYIVPVSIVALWAGVDETEMVPGTEFDTIADKLMCKKYVVYTREPRPLRQGKQPKRISRLVDGQVRLHVDTENLRKNMFEIQPTDIITITYKTHGTSFWVSHVLTKRKLSLLDRVAKMLGASIIEQEYDYVYGSRKVVKNEYETAERNHFYGEDIWGSIASDLKDFIPKGYTFYGEALGYTKNGGWIQKNYDYGTKQGERRIQIYRITSTNADGIVHDLSSTQVKEMCERFGLEYVHAFYHGPAWQLYPEMNTEEHWHENFMKELEKDYLGKDCFMCVNKVPAEGIVLRKEALGEFKAYKLKSFEFMEYETKMMDEGQEDIESNQ